MNTIAKRVCPLFEGSPKALDSSENCGSCLHYKPHGTVTDACEIRDQLLKWIVQNEKEWKIC